MKPKRAGIKETYRQRLAYQQQKKQVKKMIYRKWSLLTGPAAMLAGIVGTVVVGHMLFVDDPFLKPPQKKPDDGKPLTK